MPLFYWGFLFGFVCLFLSFHFVFTGALVAGIPMKTAVRLSWKPKKCFGHHLKEQQFFSNSRDIKLGLGWRTSFFYHHLPPIKTGLSDYITRKHLHCIKGFILLFLSYNPNAKKKLSSRQGKGATSELGGSHHFRSRHEKIKNLTV